MFRLTKIVFLLIFTVFLSACEKQQRSAKDQKNLSEIEWPVFRGSSRLDGHTDQTVADNPVLKWTFKTGYEIKSSPVIGHGRVYIGSNDGKLYALSLQDGSPVWQFDAGDDLEAAPLLAGQSVFIGSLSGDFYALDAENGTVKWQYKTDAEIYGGANVLKQAGNEKLQILFGSYDNRLYCLDAISGELNWSYETDNYINGTPATDGTWIVFGGCDEMLHILSARDGTKYGQVPAGSYVAGSTALYTGIAYLGHYGQKLMAVDLAQKSIIWQYSNPNKGGTFFSSPAVNEDFVIIGSRDHLLHCINRADGTQAWTFRTRDDVDSSPVISGNKVITASDDGQLYILDITDGHLLWSYEIGATLSGSPAVAGGFICQGAEDGKIYMFGEK